MVAAVAATGVGFAGRRGAQWYPMAAARARAPRRPRATLPAVTATSEAPASFRSSSVRPGPLALVQGGIREVLSRRRLIAYLVRADLRKTGADTLLGNLWWVLDPLLQMLVYVIFIGIILQRQDRRTTRCSCCARSCPGSGSQSAVRRRRRSVVSRGAADQADLLPEARPARVDDDRPGIVSFAFGLIPLFAITLVFYDDQLSAVAAADPGRRRRAARVLAGVRASSLSATNVFYRDVGNLSRHLLRMWFYLSPALYPRRASSSRLAEGQPDHRRTSSP